MHCYRIFNKIKCKVALLSTDVKSPVYGPYSKCKELDTPFFSLSLHVMCS